MDQTHIGYTYWQEPPRNAMPRVDVIQLPRAGRDGRRRRRGEPSCAVGTRRPVSRRRRSPFGGAREVVLPASTRTRDRPITSTSTIAARSPFEYSAQSAEPWVMVSPSRGTIDKEQRVAVSVDWSRAPVGERRVAAHVHRPERESHGRVRGRQQSRARRSATPSSVSSKERATSRWKQSTTRTR